LKIGLSRRIDPGSIVVGCLAVFGIALIGRTELENQTAAAAPNLLGFAVPVLAMLSMTVSTMAKAKYVDMAQKNHDVGPFNSFFLMYFQALPFLPLMLWPLLRNGYAGDDVAFASDLSIVVLNIASAILFSYGTLWLRDNRDWFVWFFAPVFSVAFYCLYQARMPEPFETVGIGLIVGSNLLLSLNTNNRLSYKYAVICLMIIGAFCSFQPIAPFDQYYDTLAVLSIFVSVTLSFMLSRVAGRAEHEVGLFQQAINSAAGHPSAPQIIATLTRFQNSSEPVHTARLHRTLIRMRAPDDVLNLTRQIGVSRSRGMEISNLFSLTTAIVAIVVIVLVGRPVGWQHDFFALMFAPSVVYAYFYLLDLDRSRNEAEIKTLKTRDGGLFTTFGRKRNRLNSRNTRWSIVLIVFLIMNFLVAFTAKGPL
jgi:hypothetical protein